MLSQLIMHTKAYYRLNELQHHHGITADEIRYFIEQNKLRLSFLLPKTQLLIGKAAQPIFSAYGFGYFKGLVTVGSETSLKLITNTKAKCRFVTIREGEFSDFSTEYPFSIPVPNKTIRLWTPKVISNDSANRLLAQKHPYESASGVAVLSEVVEVLKSFKKENQKIDNPWIERAKKSEKMDLYFDDFAFTLSDACLFKKDLEHLNLLGQTSTSIPHQTRLTELEKPHTEKPIRLKPEPNSSNQSVLNYYSRGSLCRKLVWHLKSMYPEKGAAHFWKLLHASQTDEELMDALDPDDDIYEIDRDTIYWNIPSKFNSEDIDKTTGRRRFENVVSDWNKIHR
jgi:hypothetical protein